MIDSLTAVISGPSSRRFEAIGDPVVPPVRWYVDGAFHVATQGVVLDLPTVRQVTVEAFDADEPDALPLAGVVPGMELAWNNAPLAVLYRVQWYTGSAWLTLAELNNDGDAIARYTARGLADETLHQFRVLGVDATGEASAILERSGFLIRRPDVPSQATAWDEEEGILTVGV